MSMSDSREIIFNSKHVTFGEFKLNTNCYLDEIKSFFRGRSGEKKESETQDEYLLRLFYNMYYKKGFAANRSNSRIPSQSQVEVTTISNNVYAILATLGIDLVAKRRVTSDIIFKNTSSTYKVRNDVLEKIINKIQSNPGKCELVNYDISFGVELEFVADVINQNKFIDEFNKIKNIGQLDVALCYTHNQGSKWILGLDGSIKTNSGQCGYELTSPILKLNSADDLEKLRKVLDLIKNTFEGTVNNSCGTHIHMSVPADQAKATKVTIRNILDSYKKLEYKVFDVLVPSSRRDNNNKYCRSTTLNECTKYQKLNARYCKFTNFFGTPEEQKCNDFHVEFRQLNGTLDFNTIKSWTKLQSIFLSSCLSDNEDNPICKKKCDLFDVLAKFEFTEEEIATLLGLAFTHKCKSLIA